MKHLAIIHTEFMKHAADHQSWWENMSNAEQKDYISRHPQTKMRPTPEKSKSELNPATNKFETTTHREDPVQMDAKREHIKSTLRELMRNPGAATRHYLPGGAEQEHGLKLKNVESVRRHGPGPNDVYKDLPGDNILRNDNGKLIHETGKYDPKQGKHIEHEVTPDEAASILREKLGVTPWNVQKKHKRQKYNPTKWNDPTPNPNWSLPAHPAGAPGTMGTSPVDQANEESKKLHGGEAPWWNDWDSSG